MLDVRCTMCSLIQVNVPSFTWITQVEDVTCNLQKHRHKKASKKGKKEEKGEGESEGESEQHQQKQQKESISP